MLFACCVSQSASLACDGSLSLNQTNLGHTYVYSSPFGGYVADTVTQTGLKDGVYFVRLSRKLTASKLRKSVDSSQVVQKLEILAGILPSSSTTADESSGRSFRYAPEDILKLASIKEGVPVVLNAKNTYFSPIKKRTFNSQVSVEFLGCIDGNRSYRLIVPNYDIHKRYGNKRKAPSDSIIEFGLGVSWKVMEFSTKNEGNHKGFALIDELD